MRKSMAAVIVATALCGVVPAALAQETGKTGTASADAAEEAFLKAYFAEKELKDYAAAEKAYAAVIETSPGAREVVARSLLGRARCLRELKRGDESGALLAQVEKEFADFADVAKEARDARQASASTVGDSLGARIRADLDMPGWRDDTWKYGERGVPTFVALLRDDSPDRVYRAAETLARMESPAAHEALMNALESRGSTYPEQVRNAAMSGFGAVEMVRRLAESKDDEIRRFALSRLVLDFEDVGATESVVGDRGLLASFLSTNRRSESYGRLLVGALARGGDARDAALARLRGEPLDNDKICGLFDPPASVLADGESVAAIAPHVVARSRAVSDGKAPSAALLTAFLRCPETAALGVRLTLTSNRLSADPGALVDAIERTGFGDSSPGSWSAPWLADALVAALGPRPKPELLKRLSAGWPAYRDWPKEEGRLPAFLNKLIASGVTDEASLLAFQEGLAPQPSRLHQQFTVALQSGKQVIGPWAVKAFLRELALTTDRETHQSAAYALVDWQQTFGDAAGLSAHVTEIVAALGEGGSPQLTEVLAKLGRPALDALRAALPTHPHKGSVVEALAQLRDKSAADAIERVLVEVGSIEDADQRGEEVASAAKALMTLRGDAAKDAVVAALTAHGGRDAATILTAVGELASDRAAFGAVSRFELCKEALSMAPGKLSQNSQAAGGFSPEMRRELAIAALRSSSVKDRRWGANEERDLLDAAAWDVLLAAAQDVDNDLRDSARDALRAIRAKENEMAEFRAMGEERATRRRIEALLAGGVDQRRAGVAAIAATGLAGMVNDLIRLAAEDKDDDVRDDARKALLAIAKSVAPASRPTSQPAEQK